MTVLRVAVPVPLPSLFDYLPPPGRSPPPAPGDRVEVPFGRSSRVGLVVAVAAESDQRPETLRPVGRVLDRGLVGPELAGLLEWCVRYYAAPPGEMVRLALPVALRRLRPFRRPPPEHFALTAAGRDADLARAPRQRQVRELLEAGPRSRAELLKVASEPVLRRMAGDGLIEAAGPVDPPRNAGPTLNPPQARAVAAIESAAGTFAAFLLAGITGSGKTEVYLAAADAVIARGGQVLVLVPEIGLTPQLVRRIESRLGRRAWTYHSGLSQGERLATWQAARDGRARVVVGTRSAVFLPLASPGLIVVDEEHDGSFKQQESPRYHGRDVAVMRARMHGIPVVLGSATPALESLAGLRAGRYRMLELPQRAGQARLPGWRVSDLRGQRALGGITLRLVEAISERLERGEQVLLYRNRRGYAPVLLCDECGWQGDCSRCTAHLTWHRGSNRLQCHHCGHAEAVPARCPACQAPVLRGQGAGTERLEEILAGHFPDTAIHRVDRDTMRSPARFEALAREVAAGSPCILVGTQMLAKGHHFPGITLAVVLDADQALYSADFRAPERLAQAVFQVAGRAGRGERAGVFMLQTRHPDHPLIRRLAAGSYLDAAAELLDERAAAGLPPARALALVRAEAHRVEDVRAFLDAAAGVLRHPDLEVSGPVPALLHRRAGLWREQLWLQAAGRARLAAVLAERRAALHEIDQARRVRWHLDMDPQDL